VRESPYTPGAGHTPPVLAGREVLESEWETMLSDINGGGRKRARDTILRGPRGVGKTVLLSRFQQLAEQQGYDTIVLQAATAGTGIIEGILARAEERLAEQRPAWQRARDALARLTGVNLSVGLIGAGLTTSPGAERRPLVDPGTLAVTLATLAREIGAETLGGGLLITLDEMQVSQPADLALLAAALQRLNVEHPSSAVAFAASALPNIDDALREAGVTHPDRLFDTKPVPVDLDRADARFAIIEPARRAGVSFSEEGIEKLLTATHRYPAHLQLFADQAWRQAEGPDEITAQDVRHAIVVAENLVETRTLDPRWQRATDRQAELLAAIAVASTQNPTTAEYATSPQITAILGRNANEWSAARIDLITEGDVYAPSRGRLAFTIPTYPPYILRNYEARRLEARLELVPQSTMYERARAQDRATG